MQVKDIYSTSVMLHEFILSLIQLYKLTYMLVSLETTLSYALLCGP